MKMNKSSLLHLLLLLLAFSLLLSTSTAAVPTSRSLKYSMKDKSALEGLHAEVMAEDREVLVVEEFAVEGRMDLVNTDYPGTGANNRHDPRSPGRI